MIQLSLDASAVQEAGRAYLWSAWRGQVNDVEKEVDPHRCPTCLSQAGSTGVSRRLQSSASNTGGEGRGPAQPASGRRPVAYIPIVHFNLAPFS